MDPHEAIRIIQEKLRQQQQRNSRNTADFPLEMVYNQRKNLWVWELDPDRFDLVEAMNEE